MSEETEKYKFSIDKIFEAKEQYHKDIAALPLKEKYIIFLKLQKAVYETMKIAGKELEPGKRVWDVEEKYSSPHPE